MNTLIRALAICCFLFVLPGLAFADTWQEKEILRRLKLQLERSLVLINRAEASSKNADSRLKIEYDNIRTDINIIVTGICIALAEPMSPAEIEPMAEKYTSYEWAE